jgi:hypothetical protein
MVETAAEMKIAAAKHCGNRGRIHDGHGNKHHEPARIALEWNLRGLYP